MTSNSPPEAAPANLQCGFIIIKKHKAFQYRGPTALSIMPTGLMGWSTVDEAGGIFEKFEAPPIIVSRVEDALQLIGLIGSEIANFQHVTFNPTTKKLAISNKNYHQEHCQFMVFHNQTWLHRIFSKPKWLYIDGDRGVCYTYNVDRAIRVPVFAKHFGATLDSVFSEFKYTNHYQADIYHHNNVAVTINPKFWDEVCDQKCCNTDSAGPM